MTVYKLDAHGHEVLSYNGDVVARGASWVYLKAVFQVERADIGAAVFYRGDVFHEWFYSDRWYNVFRVHAGDSGLLRGWYCNVTRPATITSDSVRSDDLALDLFITPQGERHLLDEDEFAALDILPAERQQARTAVDAIWTAYQRVEAPFAGVAPFNDWN